MEEAREKALQEVTDHYEAKLKEKEQQREQVREVGNRFTVYMYLYTLLLSVI